MSVLASLLPVLGALVLGALLLGSATPQPAPVPVRAKRPRRRWVC